MVGVGGFGQWSGSSGGHLQLTVFAALFAATVVTAPVAVLVMLVMVTALTGRRPLLLATAARSGPATAGVLTTAGVTAAPSSVRPKETEAEDTRVEEPPPQLPWPVSEETAGTGALKETTFEATPPTVTCTVDWLPSGSGTTTTTDVCDQLSGAAEKPAGGLPAG